MRFTLSSERSCHFFFFCLFYFFIFFCCYFFFFFSIFFGFLHNYYSLLFVFLHCVIDTRNSLGKAPRQPLTQKFFFFSSCSFLLLFFLNVPQNGQGYIYLPYCQCQPFSWRPHGKIRLFFPNSCFFALFLCYLNSCYIVCGLLLITSPLAEKRVVANAWSCWYLKLEYRVEWEKLILMCSSNVQGAFILRKKSFNENPRVLFVFLLEEGTVHNAAAQIVGICRSVFKLLAGNVSLWREVGVLSFIRNLRYSGYYVLYSSVISGFWLECYLYREYFRIYLFPHDFYSKLRRMKYGTG